MNQRDFKLSALVVGLTMAAIGVWQTGQGLRMTHSDSSTGCALKFQSGFKSITFMGAQPFQEGLNLELDPTAKYLSLAEGSQCLTIQDKVSVDFLLDEIVLPSELASLFQKTSLQLKVPVFGMGAKIKNILKIKHPAVELSDAQLSRWTEADKSNIHNLLDLLKQSTPAPPYSLVEFALSGIPLFIPTRSSPFVIGFSNPLVWLDIGPRSTLDGSSLQLSIKLGATLIDVRSDHEFEKGHFPSANHIPYIANEELRFGDLNSYLPAPGKDQFDMKRLPADKSAILIFVGSGAHDSRPHKAQLLARLAGWKNATVLYGGERARRQIPLLTPNKDNNIQPLSALDSEQLMFEMNAVIVDVRSSAEIATGRIPGSVALSNFRIPNEASSIWALDEMIDSKRLAKMANAMDLPPVITKGGPMVIFYGADEMDWRPLNLGRMFAIRFPKKKIYWLRRGLAEWAYMARIAPDRIKVETANEPASGRSESKEKAQGKQNG